MSKEKNNEGNKGFFKAFIPLSTENDKVTIFTKELEGGKQVKFLRGIATNTAIDKQNERMSKSFISKVKESLLGLNVFAEHDYSIDKTVGYVDEVSGDEENVVVDIALEDEEDNPIVKSVLKKIAHGTKIGYSIGGRILKAKKIFDEVAQKWVKELEDGVVYEVSLTAMPAGNGTWVEPIMKSLNAMDIEEEKITKEENIMKNNGETVTDVEKFQKALEEIMQADEIKSKLWDMFYAFRNAIQKIMDNDKMNAQEKKISINNVSKEFADKVEEMSQKIAELTMVVESEIGSNK